MKYTCAEELEKAYYTYFPAIYRSKNLIVKVLGSEHAMFFKHYILMVFNNLLDKKTIVIYDMNDELSSDHEIYRFVDNKLAAMSYYIDMNEGIVQKSSEQKIQRAFDSIKKLMVFS